MIEVEADYKRNDQSDTPLLSLSSFKEPQYFDEERMGKDLETETFLSPFSPSVHFGAGLLITKWCRHQYLKGLIPTILAVWYWGLGYVNLYYQISADDYITDQLLTYNCFTISSIKQSDLKKCSNLDEQTQYYYGDGNNHFYINTVNCTKPGVDFFYPDDIFDIYQNNFYLQIISSFLLPLFFTYFVYEFCYLALYDSLVIIPTIDEKTNQPVLEYAYRPFRMSWFVIRNLASWFSHDSNKFLIPSLKKPGIRIGRNTSIAANLVTNVLISTVYTLIISPEIFDTTEEYRCLKSANAVLTAAKQGLYTVLAAYCLVALIPTGYYYYRLFFCIKDIELLAYQYSQEFARRRYRGIRNLWDLIPMFIFPLPMNVVYYLTIAAPCYLIYSILKGIGYCYDCCCCCGMFCDCSKEVYHTTIERWYADYFKEIFLPKNKWWCSWFLLPIDEEELVVLQKDRKVQ